MKSLQDLIGRLDSLNVKLWDDDGYLGYSAPEGTFTPALLGELREHKSELLTLLRQGRDAKLHQQLRSRPHTGVLPVSPPQRRLWFLSQIGGANVAYNMPFVTEITGPLDIGALSRSLDELVHRHESLRTTFRLEAEGPMQVIHPPTPVEIPIDDLSELDPEARETELEQRIDREAHRAFDIERGPLLRALLFRVSPDRHVLSLVIHHIVGDGWSMGVFARELEALYGAFVASRPSPLPPPALQYADFSRWQHERLAGSVGEQQLAYWRKKLAHLEPLRLPTDRPRPAVESFRGGHYRSHVSRELTQSLQRLSREEGVTLYVPLLAAFNVLLARYSGQDDIAVSSGTANRKHPALESLIGFFVNTLVVRCDLSDNPTFRALLSRTQMSVNDAIEHEDVPFERVVEELRPERTAGQNPLAQVALTLQNFASIEFILPGLTVSRWDKTRFSTSKYDLMLLVTEVDTGLEVVFEYNSDLFDRRTIERMSAHYQNLLREVVRDLDRPIGELSLLDAAEREQILVEWNHTEAPFSSEACIHELFEAQVDRTPDAVAVVDLCGQPAGSPGVPITYRDLDRRANQVAHHLRQLGVRPEVRVGLFLERGADLIIGLLGILKAGGAVVVLDIEHPQKRLSFLLEDTGVQVVLTRASRSSNLPETPARVVDFDRGFEGEPPHRSSSSAGPTDLAYVLYTSGSTGEPNGVLIEHRGLVNSTEAHIHIMETEPGARLLHILSFNFDAAMAHLFGTICAGGALYLAPRDSDFLGAALIERMEREAITHLPIVPTMLAAMPDAELPSLRAVVVGGEKCSAALVARWGRKRRLINVYGPTETSILATFALGVPGDGPPPIGRPIANMTTYVVDGRGQLTPPGVVGELWLGGVGVARGYLNRPELTARKFIENPFGQGRLYRTGDMVRYRVVENRPPVLEFIGRADNQVKIRGYRVETAEVESALRALPRVRDAVVTVHEGASGEGARLVAYVAPALRERSKEQDLEQVASWSELSAHIETATEPDLSLDLRGWKSSYTGEDIPLEQMRVWAESTVARILDLAPREVLEIGCGTGMLLARVAPHVRSYRGTDLARHAIDHVAALKAGLPGLENVHVSQQPAHDLTGLDEGRFDTVILNSVVQYFPSADYLVEVIEGLLRLMPATGSIFLGDIRNLALLEAYHASVERSRAGGASLTRRELRRRAQRARIGENELVLNPHFFTALRAVFPRIVDVEIALKRGSYRNELSLFRYDVTLRIGAEPAPEVAIEWRDAGAEGLTIAWVRDWIARSEPGSALGLRGLPNARLHEENALHEWLFSDEDDNRRTPVALHSSSPPAGSWEPEALYSLAAELPCRVHLSWAAGHRDGSFDALVTTGDPSPPPRLPLDPPVAPGRWADLTNDPLQGKAHRELATELRRELREVLPSHLVPSLIVVLPALPLTLNGKVDLRALPAPEGAQETPSAATEPRTDVERKLAEIWCSVLGLTQISIHDNFFDLGGDSILSIQIISRAQALGLSLRPSQIFEHQTVALLATVTGGEVVASEQGAISGPVPLTPIQRWFFEQDRPSPHHFNQGFLLETPPDLDVDILQRVLSHLLMHHDALRMRFERRRSTWTQECLESVNEVALEEADLSRLAPDEQRASMDRTAARLQSSLNISAGPLMRVAVFRLGEGRPGRLLWVIHHLVVDAVSWRVLLPDLGTAYQQLAAGQDVKLPAKTTSFKRWAELLNDLARSAAFDEERAVLTLAPPVPLPVDRPGSLNRRESEAELRVRLSREETSSLIREALRSYNLGVQDILLTALTQVVARFSGSPEVWVDLEGHGREELFDDVDLSRTVGWFTSLFPVRLRLPSDDPAEALMAIKEQLRAIPRRGVRYGLLRYLHEEGERLSWPRPEISFNYLGRFRGEVESPSEFRLVWESAGPTDAAVGTRSHVLQVNGMVAGDRLELLFGYNRDIHDVETVARLAEEMIAALRHLIHHCLSPEAGAWTPSDFPFVELSQEMLREVMARLGESRRSKIEAIYPLTSAQREMLFHTLHAETKSMYVTQLVLTLDGELDVPLLRSAWEHVIRKHPLLRSCFVWQGLPEPIQVVLRDAAPPWAEHDWRGAPDQEEKLQSLGRELVDHGIPLDVAPVTRLTLVRTASLRHELFYDCHHVLTDGWSLGVILREVFGFYRAAKEGRKPLDLSAGSYDSYLRWLGKLERAPSEAFWRRALHGFVGPTPLVLERNPPAAEHRHCSRRGRLDARLTADLKAAAEAERLTLATLIEGAWALFLSRTSGREDVLFGTMASGRDGNIPGVDNMVGLFIHMLPVRVHIDEAKDLWTWLRALQTARVEAREHQYVPLDELQRIAAVPAGTPLFRSMVIFENYPLDHGIFSGAGLDVSFRDSTSPHHSSLWVIAAPGQELPISFEYDAARFDPRSIDRMAAHLEQLLRAMVGAPSPRLGQLLQIDSEQSMNVANKMEEIGG